MEIILNKSLKLPSSNIDGGRVLKNKINESTQKRERKGEPVLLPMGCGLMGTCWLGQAPPIAPAHNRINSEGGRIRGIKPSGEAACIDWCFVLRSACRKSDPNKHHPSSPAVVREV